MNVKPMYACWNHLWAKQHQSSVSYTTSYLGGYKAINLLSEVVDEGYYGVVLGGWGGEGGDGVEQIPKQFVFFNYY